MELNYDVLIIIFNHLDFEDLKNATLTCQTWNRVIGSSTKLMKKFRVKITENFDLQGFWSHRKYEAISVENLSMTRAVEILNHYKVAHLKHYEHRGGIIRGGALLTLLARTPNLETLNMNDSRVFVQKQDPKLYVKLDRLKKITINPPTSNIYKYLRIPNVSDYTCRMKIGSSNVMKVDYEAPARLLSTSHMLTKLEIDHKAVCCLFNKEFTDFRFTLHTLKFNIVTDRWKNQSDIYNNVAAFMDKQKKTLTTLDVTLEGAQYSPIILQAIFNCELTNLHLTRDDSNFADNDIYNDLKESMSIRKFSIRGWMSYRNVDVVLNKMKNLEEIIIHNDSYFFPKANNYAISRLTVPVESLMTSCVIRYPRLCHLIITNYSGMSIQRLNNVRWFIQNNETIDTLEIYFSPTEYFSIESLSPIRVNKIREVRLHGPIIFLYQIYRDLQQSPGPQVITLIPYESQYRKATMTRDLPQSWYKSHFVSQQNTSILDFNNTPSLTLLYDLPRTTQHVRILGPLMWLKKAYSKLKYNHDYNHLESVIIDSFTLLPPFNLCSNICWNPFPDINDV